MRTIMNILVAGAVVAAPVAVAAENTRASESVPAFNLKVGETNGVLTERSSKPVGKAERAIPAAMLPLYIIGGIVGTVGVLEITGAINIVGGDDEPAISPGI